MTPRPLVLAGAGGFARETAELVNAINDREPTWDLLGFLDDNEALHGERIDGVPVIGPIDWAGDRDDVAVVLCLGSPANYTTRAKVSARLDLPDARYATLIHPTAVVPRSTSVGAGTVLHATCVATGHSSIGRHVAVMPAVVFTHDDAIGDFVTIGAGVRFAGNVTVGTGAYVGSGALIREGRSIGAWSLVGMGSVVTRDVPDAEVWAGVPASFLRPASAGPAIPATAQETP